MTATVPDRGRSFLVISILAVLFGGVQLASAQQGGGAAAGAAGPAPSTSKPKDAAKEPGDKNAVSYSLGVIMGSQLHQGGVHPEDVSTERVTQGFRDGLAGKAKLSDADRANINKLLHASYDAMGESNHRAAAKFLAANKTAPGVLTTASGLEYKVINAGNGPSPKSTDQVVVNYRGTLIDGTEFDSSYKRGQPATFPVGAVIPGWTEALQLMKPGAKYQLWVPPQLAYDMRVNPGAPIPPGSMLVFDVELLSIKPPQVPAGTPTGPAGAPTGSAQPAPAPQPK
jgi:FKBP-type peptidyl-prolyl cis-trans isomerase FkpA